MAIYVKSGSNSAETVNSSMDAITIASSFRSQGVGLVAPAIDIAASDSPLLSEAAQSEKRTVEYIDSDDPMPFRQESSSSSDDLELLEARAAAAEARLKLEEAKKKKKSSSASRSSVRTRDRSWTLSPRRGVRDVAAPRRRRERHHREQLGHARE